MIILVQGFLFMNGWNTIFSCSPSLIPVKAHKNRKIYSFLLPSDRCKVGVSLFAPVWCSPASVCSCLCEQIKSCSWHGRNLPSQSVPQRWIGIMQHPLIFFSICLYKIICSIKGLWCLSSSAWTRSLWAIAVFIAGSLNFSSTFPLSPLPPLYFLPGSPSWPGEKKAGVRTVSPCSLRDYTLTQSSSGVHAHLRGIVFSPTYMPAEGCQRNKLSVSAQQIFSRLRRARDLMLDGGETEGNFSPVMEVWSFSGSEEEDEERSTSSMVEEIVVEERASHNRNTNNNNNNKDSLCQEVTQGKIHQCVSRQRTNQRQTDVWSGQSLGYLSVLILYSAFHIWEGAAMSL